MCSVPLPETYRNHTDTDLEGDKSERNFAPGTSNSEFSSLVMWKMLEQEQTTYLSTIYTISTN